MVAEDEYLVSEDIIRGLKALGYADITEAADGEEAYKMTRALHPDVVLMDIMMPKLDGIQVARKIHEYCPTPIVITTADESADSLIDAGSAGVSAFLTKPPNKEEIERAIVIALTRHSDQLEVRCLNKKLEQALEGFFSLPPITQIKLCHCLGTKVSANHQNLV